jgi:long-chain fatty acid transport protein
MSQRLKNRLHFAALITVPLSLFSLPALASDFSLPFVSISGLGNAYAGWAAEAYDASTTTTNPAGLVKIKKPQLIVAALDVTGHTQFEGTATTPFTSQTGIATATAGGFAPLIYFATPLSEKVFFGFGINGPFGLGTNYPKNSIVRYAATRSQILDVDLSPSLGIKINDKFSIGLGFDAQRLSITLKNMYGPPLSMPTDSEGQNHLAGWGYGWHGGVLYQLMPATRMGLSFNSQTMFHTTGDSEVFGPTGELRTTNQRASTPLPARTQVSIYQDINPKWSVMGSVFYERWSTINQIILRNTMIPGGMTVPVTIPFQYHDTFDYALGTNYKFNEKLLLRTGFRYFNTPSNNRDRSVPDPVGRMILLGIGAHYQQNLHVGYDIGYAHDFFKRTVINFVTPVATVVGNSTMGTDIFGLQVTWNI